MSGVSLGVEFKSCLGLWTLCCSLSKAKTQGTRMTTEMCFGCSRCDDPLPLTGYYFAMLLYIKQLEEWSALWILISSLKTTQFHLFSKYIVGYYKMWFLNYLSYVYSFLLFTFLLNLFILFIKKRRYLSLVTQALLSCSTEYWASIFCTSLIFQQLAIRIPA